MTEDQLRTILADLLKVEPDSITDASSTETVKGWDSLTVMNLVMTIESKVDWQFSDDEIATLTSWPNIKAVMASHEKGTEAPFYKCLVLDADGVLWDGIIDEGDHILPNIGAQAIYRSLKERGVLLALASKNDPETIEDAFRNPAMLLRLDDFAVTSCGWGNKVFSLKGIAKKLNIGLESMVFVDDSDFECAYVRAQLPMVKVMQFPSHSPEEVAALFPTMIDTSKTEQYRALAAAEATRPQFKSEEDFLASLSIEVEIHCNRRDEIARIAELCQKSNQFNLTTTRYTEQEIGWAMDNGAEVYSLNVKDKFGDQGLCGVLIVDHGEIAEFCLSCRILGRGIEFAPWRTLFPEDGMPPDLPIIEARYSPTAKNGQVAHFWDAVGLIPYDPMQDGFGKYGGYLDVDCPSWIKVTRA